MAAPNQSTCEPWATSDDICSPCDDYSLPVGVLDEMIQVASDILFHLSGRQFPGECDRTIRPCSQRLNYGGPPDRTVNGDIVYTGFGCYCGLPSSCGCGGLSEIPLGIVPVNTVTAVKVDGVTLDSADYRVDDYRTLVRLDGERWPCCQDLSLPDTADNTFSVTFTYGRPVPPGGVHAAAVLACELTLACSPESVGECRLPKRVQSITRQGVSMVLLDPLDLFQEGRVGLAEVDLWLASVNPHRLKKSPAVISPDQMERGRVVGT